MPTTQDNRLEEALDELIRRVKVGSGAISIASARQAVLDAVEKAVRALAERATCSCGKSYVLCQCHRKV